MQNKRFDRLARPLHRPLDQRGLSTAAASKRLVERFSQRPDVLLACNGIFPAFCIASREHRRQPSALRKGQAKMAQAVRGQPLFKEANALLSLRYSRGFLCKNLLLQLVDLLAQAVPLSE